MWCVRAAGRGLCAGDVCRARAVAWEVADAVSVSRSRSSSKSMHSHMDSLFEAWLSFEHPKAYERAMQKRDAETSVGEEPMSASSLNEMVEKMRAAAAFAPHMGPDTMDSNMMPVGTCGR